MVVVFLTDNITTTTKVVLSCSGLLVGLWQCTLSQRLTFQNWLIVPKTLLLRSGGGGEGVFVCFYNGNYMHTRTSII